MKIMKTLVDHNESDFKGKQFHVTESSPKQLLLMIRDMTISMNTKDFRCT